MIFSLKHTTLRFNNEILLRDFSRDFFIYERLFLSGVNGAGKSTFLKALAGVGDFQGGSFTRGEFTPRKIGYFSQHSTLYEVLSVEENFRFFTALNASRDRADVEVATDRCRDHLERWGLLRKRDTKVLFLSEGQRTRLALAILFASPFKYLLLDEPFAALDEEGALLLLNHLQAPHIEFLMVTSHDQSIKSRLGCTGEILLGGER